MRQLHATEQLASALRIAGTGREHRSMAKIMSELHRFGPENLYLARKSDGAGLPLSAPKASAAAAAGEPRRYHQVLRGELGNGRVPESEQVGVDP